MFYTSLGITATEIMTDNSAYYRSRLFHNTLGGITHIFTHPHRPQTNNTYQALSPRNEPTHATTTQTPTEPTPTKPGTTPTITTDPTPASEKTLPNAYKISVGTTATEGGILDYEQ